MKITKIIVIIIGFLAAYKAAEVLLFGTPTNPKKAITGWSEQVKAALPKQINPNTTLVALRAEWFDAGLYGADEKIWNETYTARIPPSQARLAEEKEMLIQRLCSSEMHKKIMSLGIAIQVRINIPKSYLFKDFEVSKTFCQAKSFKE